MCMFRDTTDSRGYLLLCFVFQSTPFARIDRWRRFKYNVSFFVLDVVLFARILSDNDKKCQPFLYLFFWGSDYLVTT